MSSKLGEYVSALDRSLEERKNFALDSIANIKDERTSLQKAFLAKMQALDKATSIWPPIIEDVDAKKEALGKLPPLVDIFVAKDVVTMDDFVAQAVKDVRDAGDNEEIQTTIRRLTTVFEIERQLKEAKINTTVPLYALAEPREQTEQEARFTQAAKQYIRIGKPDERGKVEVRIGEVVKVIKRREKMILDLLIARRGNPVSYEAMQTTLGIDYTTTSSIVANLRYEFDERNRYKRTGLIESKRKSKTNVDHGIRLVLPDPLPEETAETVYALVAETDRISPDGVKKVLDRMDIPEEDVIDEALKRIPSPEQSEQLPSAREQPQAQHGRVARAILNMNS